MTELDPAEARGLTMLDRYENGIRRELESLGSRMLPDLDASASMLRAALTTKRAVNVGFLGESQVGKSSLINALVGRFALPTGGVGPLTAQATRLRYASAANLDVRYHDRRRLNQFLFAIRQYLAARGELPAANEPAMDDDLAEDATAAAWSSAASIEAESGRPLPQSDTGEHLLGQARLMLDAAALDNAAVHDAVRLILGLPPLGDAAAVESCATRIEEIRGLLGGSASLTQAQEGEHGFTQALHANAAGWRSPLVAELDLALDVELLSRVEVVDLPGVGVVGDPAGRVAESFVRDDASALVIVARNNGLTHEVVGLLERTGVITRLLFGGESTKANPIHVIFAITRLDDVAQDRWKQEKSEAKSRGVKPPTREEVFQRLSTEMAAKAKQQIRSVLASSSAFDDLSPEMRARREEVVKDLCDRTEVICVSSKDFMNLQSDDDEDRNLAFLQDADATNVPAFRERLAELAERARGSRRGRITAALESFRSLLGSHVDALAVGTREPTGITTDADRFRAALKEVVPPFKARALSQRRELAKYLNERIPPKLDGISL